MTIECVDGQMATPHITGAQKGAMHAGVVGDGCYVLATGNKCKATQNSATSVTIGTGDLFIHGRHHQITAAETVTIRSGTQGQKRNDLICAVYHRDAQGIEQPTVTVLKGTPTTGTPADPTVPAGNVLNGDAVDYFPLYRVSLNGTTASAPVQLFKVLPTLASLGDSVSPIKFKKVITDGLDINGVVINGIALITVLWTNVGAFLSRPWANTDLAHMVGWKTRYEMHATFTDNIGDPYNQAARYLYVVENAICFRTSYEATIPAGHWHMGFIAVPVTRT